MLLFGFFLRILSTEAMPNSPLARSRNSLVSEEAENQGSVTTTKSRRKSSNRGEKDSALGGSDLAFVSAKVRRWRLSDESFFFVAFKSTFLLLLTCKTLLAF